jgi:hypothetical protein
MSATHNLFGVILTVLGDDTLKYNVYVGVENIHKAKNMVIL